MNLDETVAREITGFLDAHSNSGSGTPEPDGYIRLSDFDDEYSLEALMLKKRLIAKKKRSLFYRQKMAN